MYRLYSGEDIEAVEEKIVNYVFCFLRGFGRGEKFDQGKTLEL